MFKKMIGKLSAISFMLCVALAFTTPVEAQRSSQTPPPAVEWRKRQPRATTTVKLSAAAVLEALKPPGQPKYDVWVETVDLVGTAYFFDVGYISHTDVPPLTENFVGFTCWVRTTPSSKKPWLWLQHPCKPSAMFLSHGPPAKPGTKIINPKVVRVPVPEPEPLQQSFLTITAFKVRATVGIGTTYADKNANKNNDTAEWVWE